MKFGETNRLPNLAFPFSDRQWQDSALDWMKMETSVLNPTQRYSCCALFALALNQSQARHLIPSISPPSLDEDSNDEGFISPVASSVADRPHLWIHQQSGLLFPIFKFMDVNDQAWKGLIETAGSSQFRDHICAFLNVISEDSTADSRGRVEKELAMLESVDAVVLSQVQSDDSAEPNARGFGGDKETCEDQSPPVDRKNVANQSEEGKSLNEVVEQPVCSESHIQNVEKPIQDGILVNPTIRVTVLYELLLACLLSNKEVENGCSTLRNGYDSRHRVALRLLATWLDIEWIKMEALELKVACYIMDTEKRKNYRKGDSKSSKWKHVVIIGGAALAGGSVLALTGGFAAPAIAQGIGALAPTLHALVPAIGASGFAAAVNAVGSFGGSVAVAASFGAAGAGLTGSKVAKRLGDIEEFEFKAVGENHNQGRLAVGILVPGIVFKEEDFIRPWHDQMGNLERYGIQWESKKLIAFSNAIRDWVTSTIRSQALQWGAMMTALRTLITAVALPASLITAIDIIDSNWAMALDRSDKAGIVLAETLLEGLHGNRPVTLIGFSAGARVIFKCLQCLAEDEKDNVGLVERVVLLGAPISIEGEEWMLARKMVAGRFVNAYSKNDWTLGIAFRAHLLSRGLAGIQPVSAPGIENVDVADILESHISYLGITEQILKQLDLDSCNPVSENIFKRPAGPSKDSISET